MIIKTLGLDIGKNTFHLVGLDAAGHVQLRKRVTRAKLFGVIAALPSCLIGLEACPGAHFLARELEHLGHAVRLLPPQYVRAYVKSNKNDFVDAEAIAEAVGRPTMRFVPVKSVEQLEVQALHRVRDRLVSQRTRLINQIRAILLEQGIVLHTGRRLLQRELPSRLAAATDALPPRLLALLKTLIDEWHHLDAQLHDVTGTLTALARELPACRRLSQVPGIGVVSATAIVSAIGDGQAFHTGRDFAAWVGLVPRQHSTGGKPRLLGISKRGNRHLRRLLVLGAHTVAKRAVRDRHHFGPWLTRLQARTHHNVATVALANKLARIAWAVLRHDAPYTPHMPIAA